MKKVFLAILISVLCFIPFSVNAEEKEYKTLNLDEALKEEEIDHDFSNYKETDDQAIIYLFRGKGCAYCKKFLTYLNSIVDDYGKYFKVVSYEVWYDNDNAELMEKVCNLLGQKAEGVPYIVIGDKVFAGYAESYNDEINNDEFNGLEGNWILFKWFNINDLDNVLIEPKEIKDILKNNKNHIVDGF